MENVVASPVSRVENVALGPQITVEKTSLNQHNNVENMVARADNHVEKLMLKPPCQACMLERYFSLECHPKRVRGGPQL